MVASTSRIPVLLWLTCALSSALSAGVQTGSAATPPLPVPGDEVPEGLSGDDWTGIREAYEAGRHAIHEVDGGYQARNPGQQWLTRFDGRGFSIKPDVGGWTWGLELESCRFGGNEQALVMPDRVRADGQRVSYVWNAAIEEWYVNDSRGLEHGYTIHRRPPQDMESGGSPLTFTLSVRGDLQLEVDVDGLGARFSINGGAVVLAYTGLLVVDAAGRELAASFTRLDGKLCISIDEREACYPVTVDPVAQQAYLKASNTNADDLFGSSVAMSGDTVVVGAPGEASAATGVNGDQGDNSLAKAGAAYVFVRSGASWSQQAYLKASNTNADDHFGCSLSVSGDTVVVAAYFEASSATGVNGDQSDNSASRAGAAYVFVRTGTSWSQQAYLKASNTDAQDWFGDSVAVSGDTVLVGAYREASRATGVNGNQSDNGAPAAGAAYIFVRSGTLWSQQVYLKASNADADDMFGRSVAVSGDTVVIGADRESSSATGVNGDQSDNSAPRGGAAYVFVRNGTAWSQEAYLKASNTDADDHLGYSVALSTDTAVVGAYGEDSNATGVGGDQSDNSASRGGAAYVFVRSGTAWSQEAYLKASNTDAGDYFGNAVAVLHDTLVVAARSERSKAPGVNGDQSNNEYSDAGAAYLFLRSGTTWSQQAYLKASLPASHAAFGISASVSDDTVLVGAFGERSGSTGVNGDPNDGSAPSSGAAYAFDLNAPPLSVPFCFGDPGSGTPCPCGNDNDGSVPGSGCASGSFASGAQLTASGQASVITDTLVLTCTHMHRKNFGLYFQAENQVNNGVGVPFGDGLRCVGGNLIRLQNRMSDLSGASSTTIGISTKAGNISPGDIKRYQCWYRNPTGSPCGFDFNLSNGCEIIWGI
jgi:hypothetical protein